MASEAAVGRRTFSVRFTDDHLIAACNQWRGGVVKHADAPSIAEVAELRDILGEITMQDTSSVCILWLRNEFVRLRKKSLLNKEDES